ncbi:MAG: PAS domain S-box protein [Bacteroidales bacterium]
MDSLEKKELLDKISRYQKEIDDYRENKKFLERLVEESAVAIIIGNSKGEIIKVNNKTLVLTRFTTDELLGKKINDLFIDEDIPAGLSPKNLKEPSTEFSNEHILQRKDGKKIFVSTHTKLLPDNAYQIIINDINKRKKAELALVESEKRYRLLAENIHDVVWTSSVRLKTIFISPSIAKITGFTPEVYYLKPLSELVTPISFQLIRDTIRKERELLKKGSHSMNKYSKTIEIKLLHKKLMSIWVEVTSTVIQNQFGEIVGFQGVLKNIDEHKRTIETLNRNRLKYNFAIKSTNSGVWELSADLTKINIDENLLHILGYNSNEIKPLLNEWISLTEKSDRLAVIDHLQDLLDEKISSITYECRRIHKDGRLFWFRDFVKVLTNAEGKIYELLGTSKDITYEKITEEKKFRYFANLDLLINYTFRFLNLKSPDEIYDFTGEIINQYLPDSIIIFAAVNPESRETKPFRFYGISNESLHKNSGMFDYIPYKSTFRINTHIFNLLDKEVLVEYKGGTKSFLKNILPEQKYSEINSQFKVGNLLIIGQKKDGKLHGCILIILREEMDIKNKEFLEIFISLSSIISNKKETEDELKRLNNTKDKFFSIISHDLKNPFNALVGFSGLIINNIENIPREKILEFSKLIHSSAQLSYELMKNLFEWASAQMKGIEIKPVSINITEFLKSNINLFTGEAIRKNITIQTDLSLDFDFNADIDMMNTIMRNLISNALKFTQKGGQIKLSCNLTENNIEFFVEDNGIGISGHDIDKIFTAGSFKSKVGTENERGTGLGLILCREFVEMHGGKIWVESQEGKGSKFSFFIPKTGQKTDLSIT